MRLAESKKCMSIRNRKITDWHYVNVDFFTGKPVWSEKFGVDFDTTLEWVKKKNPNMSLDEQKRFAQNIINKKEREENARLAQIEKNREELRRQSEERERKENERMIREQEMRERDGYDKMNGIEKFYYDQTMKGDHWVGD